MIMDLSSNITKFLAANNIDIAKVTPMQADASFRKYYRAINAKGDNVILMDSSAEQSSIAPFINIAKLLTGNGFSAPKIIAQDAKAGLLLLEDFGDLTYNLALKEPNKELEQTLYETAIDLLINLHKQPAPDNIIPYYDDEKLIAEASLLNEWYIPVLQEAPPSAKMQEEFKIIWQHLIPYTRFIPETIVLKDYMADNLMWLERRKGIARTGVLDFQDAVIGSPIYDIVSLLEDARRDVSDDIVQAMINKYLQNRTDIARKDFLACYAILGTQRNFKILGIFARKATRDKDSRYLKFLPRVWKYLEKDLRHPLLLPLKAWIDKAIAPELRQSREAIKARTEAGI
jgi:aminoglycoside/choline kinase family phosphotransferase